MLLENSPPTPITFLMVRPLGTSHNLSWGGGGVEEKLFFVPNFFQTPTNSTHVF